MTFLRIWIHFVFITKDRQPLLRGDVLHQLIRHLRESTRQQKIYLDHIGGGEEHFHCLISLGKEQTIAQIARMVGDESAEWLNENQWTTYPVSWEDYYAVSVSESQLDDVRKYIRNQEKYHKHRTFGEEANEFARRYGWRIHYASGTKDKAAGSLDFSDLEERL